MAAAAAVVDRCEARQLMALYKVPGFEGPDALLRHIAAARGKLRKGGLPDEEVPILQRQTQLALHVRRSCMKPVAKKLNSQTGQVV